MIFEQLFDNKSSTYTYILSSGEGREALIIDPVIEHTEEYIKLLEKLKLKLVKVIDTHIHADHITGLNELSKRTSCTKIMGENSKSEVVDLRVKENEKITILDVRYRTCGDMPITGAVESTADTFEKVINEIAATRTTERGTRADDKRSETAMEDRKKQGYF